MADSGNIANELSKKPPPMLYKFRDWTDTHHQKLLTERQLWVPHAHNLNDPFDGRIRPRFNQIRNEYLLKKLAERLVCQGKYANQVTALTELTEMADKPGFWDTVRDEDEYQEYCKENPINIGVLSFASVRHIPLLWSHYARGHKGFCVGIDSTALEKRMDILLAETGIERYGNLTNYLDVYPKFIPADDEVWSAVVFEQLLSTKSTWWSYEREYRYLFPNNFDFPLEINPACVSEVILGAEMSDGDKLVIRLLAQEQFPEAKLLQAKAIPFSFELEFVPVVDD